jgi:hypothetical protein
MLTQLHSKISKNKTHPKYKYYPLPLENNFKNDILHDEIPYEGG